MKVDIVKMNHNGEGIGKIGDKIVFVPKTIVGDKVDVSVVREKKRFDVALVNKYYERGRGCVNSRCKYYYLCGGCQISNMNYERQLDYKRDKVRDIFRKYSDIDIRFDIIGSELDYQYRNKVTLHVEALRLGFYQDKSHQVLEIDECCLVSDRVNKVIEKLKEFDLAGIKKIVIREACQGVMVVFYGTHFKEKIFLQLEEFVDTIVVNEKVIYGDGYIVEEINDLQFVISPMSFFQVNTLQTVKLYDKVREYAKALKNEVVIDLYCGIGTIGMYLARDCKKVIGIEVNDSAIRDAKRNKDLNNISNIEFVCGDVGKVFDSGYEGDIVIVDPPRSGLDENTRKVLLEKKFKKIVYVSCNPMTLVRDLVVLSEGYVVVEGSLIDMFPQTYHCETVVLLCRK